MDKSIDSDKMIEALREEYEKKFQEQETRLKSEFESKQKEQEDRHIREMRALLSGRVERTESDDESDDKTFEEDLLEKVKNKFIK